MQPVVGSIARFGFPGAPVDLHMRVDELDPGRRVAWACLGLFPHWAGTTVRWDITPAKSGTGATVVFRQDGWSDTYPEMDFAGVNYTWGRIVGALKAYAETGTPSLFLW